MTPELRPCPFCGDSVCLDIPDPERSDDFPYETMLHASDAPEWCPLKPIAVPAADWNRRTPDLTEALARLKALGEAIGRYGRYPGIEPCDDWSKEIAAIRKALGGSE